MISSDNLQKIWKVELDLLEKLKEICNKYNLNYCASSGTLLGAARHKGFIPWDDDIDVFLMWSDYKKLMEVAPKECVYPYFFQSYRTDRNGEASACRLRRSDTTGFTMWEKENTDDDYEKGIFIDIFPLFYVTDSELLRKVQKKAVMFFWKAIRGHDAMAQIDRGGTVNQEYSKYVSIYKRMSRIMSIQSIKKAYLTACAFPFCKTKTVGATSSRCHLPSLMWESKLYDSYIELPFENTTITCPASYEAILEKQYGNWRIPVENGSRHEMAVVNTEIPWREYMKMEGMRF